MKSEKEICKLLREEKLNSLLNSKYYIKIDYRLDEFYGENKGKLSSEIYPHLHSAIQNIDYYIIELLYDRESKEYKSYFDDMDDKPFIIEVWERTDNIMKLIYKRKNEYEDFIEVNSK